MRVLAETKVDVAVEGQGQTEALEWGMVIRRILEAEALQMAFPMAVEVSPLSGSERRSLPA